jgi:hypothetical protein
MGAVFVPRFFRPPSATMLRCSVMEADAPIGGYHLNGERSARAIDASPPTTCSFGHHAKRLNRRT